MKSPILKGSKKTKPTETQPKEWYNRIDYWQVIQKTVSLFWFNRKRLITICILLVLTGGQALTFHSSSISSSGGPGDSTNVSNKDTAQNDSWQATLNEINSKEDFKIKAREFMEDKETLYGTIFLAIIAVIIVGAILVVLFLLNCHFHTVLLRTIQTLEKGVKKSKEAIKGEMKGKWRQLAIMRLIFGLMYLGTLILFFLPAGFFALQKSWALAILMAGVALFSIFIVFVILSYVFRYSLLYYVTSNLSVKESIDRGHEFFLRNWKESVLASLINFAGGIAAAMAGFFVFLLIIFILALVGGTIWLIIWLIAGMTHPMGIAIGVGSVAIIVLIVLGIIVTAVWQGLVVIFWYLVFKELAGYKIAEVCEETAKEAATVKAKKPAVLARGESPSKTDVPLERASC